VSSDTPSGPLDFDAHTASARTRLAKASNITLWVFLAGPIWPVWDTILAFLIAFAISRPARAGGGVLRVLILLVVFYMLVVACGVLYNAKIAKTSWFTRLLVGRQRFIPLGGPPHRMFDFILKCDSALDLILKPEDRSILPTFGNLEFTDAERSYRSEYQRLKRDPDD
jgi:hypothetical protein